MAKQKARKITDAPIGCTHPSFLVEDGKCKGCGKPVEQQDEKEKTLAVCEKVDECIHDEDGEEIELPPLNICEKADCHAYEPTAANHCKVYHSGTDAAQCDKFTKGPTGEIPQPTFSSSDTSAPFDRELPVALNDEELAKTGSEMSRLVILRDKTKEDLKALARSLNTLIKDTEKKLTELSHSIEVGTELRKVPCYWQFDPAHMSKRLIRCDTGALVEERAMELLDLEQCPNYQGQNSVENAEDLRQKQATEENPASETGEPAAEQGEASLEEETPATGPILDEDGWPDPGPDGFGQELDDPFSKLQ